MKFEQMNLTRPLLRAIREVGYTEPTPIQKQTVPHVLAGRDVLGCAQTGTGKTAAFALPMLQRIAALPEVKGAARGEARPIRALILTPTRELALQIHENFVLYGKYLPVRTAVIFGGVNQNPQIEQLRAGVDILVATPGRLNDLIGQGHISLDDIHIFVLDEADRMLDMGFIHDVKKVMAKLPAVRQTLLFSATMPPQVEDIAAQLLTKPACVKISPVTSTVDSVEQSVYFVAKSDKTALLLHLLNGNGVAGALVFTRTKHGADQVARQLNKNKVKALAIHGNKSQNARQNALNQFKAGEIDVLVATDIAARGIDIVELPTVINYNVPEEPETYIHRIGRTGRAGLSGEAITFCCSDELESFRDIEKLIGKHVTERTCAWSVVDMQPTKPEKKQPQPSRRAKAAETATPAAPARQPSPAETPAAQESRTGGRRSRQRTKPQQAAQPAVSESVKPSKQPAPAAQPSIKPSKQPAPAAQPSVKQSKQQAPAAQESEKQREKRRRPEPRRTHPTAPQDDRRFADSDENDGATGQQIVTKFNRSVWLEFNEVKRPKRMWQTPAAPSAPTREKKPEQSPSTTEQAAAPAPRRRGRKHRA